MKKGLWFVPLALLLAACQPPQPQEEETAATPPRPVVPVSQARTTDMDKTVSQADIDRRYPFLSKEDQQFVNTLIGRQNLLQLIAREKLIALDAQAQHINQDPDYLAQLTQKRIQLDDIFQDYAAQTLQEFWYAKQRKQGALQITEEEINEYYKKYPYEMTIRQIIVDNAEQADQLLRTLKSNRSRWKELSRQYNRAPETLRGEISFMPGEFLPDLEVIAANSATGSVQGFFKTAYGFHIIMKTSEKKLSRAEAEPRIRSVLENKKLDKLIESLQNKYEVVIYDKNE